MKVSPNREQMVLFVMMNILLIFIVGVLSVEMLFSSGGTRQGERAVSAAEAARGGKGAETVASGEVKPPEPEPRATDSATPPPAPVAGESRGRESPPHPLEPDHAGKARPPMPTPSQALVAAAPPPPVPREETAAEEKGVDGGFIVQLGAFSTEEKAGLLVGKLSAMKLDGKPLPVTQQKIKVGAKPMFRVRMGPFATQAKAKQAAALASRSSGVEGTVLRAGQ